MLFVTGAFCAVLGKAPGMAPGPLNKIVALFTPDPAVVTDGSLYLRVIAFAQIGQTFEIILEGALAGAGYTMWPQVASTTLTLLRVPLAAWWSGRIGLLGIWLALSATAVARGIAMTLFWLRGSWHRATV
jgi:Na+-driven multidrug efflux pump